MNLQLVPGPPPKKEFEIKYYSNYREGFVTYWNSYNVSVEVLKKFKVYQVSYISFVSNSGKELTFDYDRQRKIVAGYEINGRIKTYIPRITSGEEPAIVHQEKAFGYKNQKGTDIFGLAQLPQQKVSTIIVAAGEKDTLVLNSNGFNAISMQSENQLPRNENNKVIAR